MTAGRALGHLAIETFLAEYWQQQPVLLRDVLPRDGERAAFPLDANDLAGLACEPLAEARIITGPDAENGWSLQHGPFDEAVFDGIGDRCWTLLVQDVEKHYPPAGELPRLFDFLPSWRVDDLMVSFAAPGGSVGPHVDQYDVFLCQIEGHRRWEIAKDFDSTRREAVPVDMLATFDPESSWEVSPGDVLYLPPGVAHHGVALEPCLTASVGFRAPSAADLALALGEWLAQRDDDGGRYQDPPLGPQRIAGLIDQDARQGMAQLLIDALGEDFEAFLGMFLSRFRLANEPVPSPATGSEAHFLARINAGTALALHPWGRYMWIEQGDHQATLFASGHSYPCSAELARWLCGGAGDVQTLPGWQALDLEDKRCLARLYRDGQLLLSV